MTSVIAGLALALLLSVMALVREVRLRRALQELLRRLLTHWRNRFATTIGNVAVSHSPVADNQPLIVGSDVDDCALRIAAPLAVAVGT